MYIEYDSLVCTESICDAIRRLKFGKQPENNDASSMPCLPPSELPSYNCKPTVKIHHSSYGDLMQQQDVERLENANQPEDWLVSHISEADDSCERRAKLRNNRSRGTTEIGQL